MNPIVIPLFISLFLWTLSSGQTGSSIISATGVHGGVVVHLNFSDVNVTAGLRVNGKYLVHGLHTDAVVIAKARQTLMEKELYGEVSVDRFCGNLLPYADNMVSLLVADNLGSVSMAEVNRVLSPHGVSYIKNGGSWTKSVKPYPPEMDEWTHHLHSPDNNGVSQDQQVGPPRYLRFLAEPKYARDHEHLASLSAGVTGGGRLFVIVDKASPSDLRFEPQWALVARDAFNGKLLWEKPIDKWASTSRWFRTGPTDLHYRLAVRGEQVYATLGLSKPVIRLNAADGTLQHTFAGTEKCSQLIITDSILVTLIDPWVENAPNPETKFRITSDQSGITRTVKVFNAETGKELWTKEVGNSVFQTMAVKKGNLFYQTTEKVFAVDLLTGVQRWSASVTVNLTKNSRSAERGWESPIMVAGDQGLYIADLSVLTALSLDDGSSLWTPATQLVSRGYNAPVDLHIINGKLWTTGGAATWGTSSANKRVARNLLTGSILQTYSGVMSYMHDRCYRSAATVNYLILPKAGPEFIDLTDGSLHENYWTRGTCNYGVLPANGLLYAPPHSCACNMQVKLNGILAFANSKKAKPAPSNALLFEQGAAYKAADDHPEQYVWPTYRADNKRGSFYKDTIGTNLAMVWKNTLGGKLSSLTADDKRVYVAAVDRHTVYALDQYGGKVLWSYTAGGRVDSPPTVYKGMVLFGSADGWLYALKAADGVLCWRRRLAPEDTRILVHEQLESKWPLHGAALVLNDQIIATAGRQTYIDSGIFMYKLDPLTGDIQSQNRMYEGGGLFGQPNRGRDMEGGKNDVLSAEGTDAFMRHVKLNFATGSTTGKGMHLFSQEGFLPSEWWYRTYWHYSNEFRSYWGAWTSIGNANPSGRIMTMSDTRIFGYGRNRYPEKNTGQWSGEFYRLYGYNKSKKTYLWSKQIGLHVRAMASDSRNTLFIAGVPDIAVSTKENKYVLKNNQEAVDAFAGVIGSKLIAVAGSSGDFLQELTLESAPVFDGLIAGPQHLYMAMLDGSVVCYNDAGGRVIGTAPRLRDLKSVNFTLTVGGKMVCRFKAQEIKTLQLFDLKGRLILEALPVNGRVDVDSREGHRRVLSSSVVMARLVTGAGNHTFKFVLPR